MGRESSITLYTFQPERCACSLFLSNLEKKSCCHDESQLLVLEDDQTPSFPLTLSSPDFYKIADLYVSEVASTDYNTAAQTAFRFIDPPPPPKEPLYKVLCAYTFYEEEAVA